MAVLCASPSFTPVFFLYLSIPASNLHCVFPLSQYGDPISDSEATLSLQGLQCPRITSLLDSSQVYERWPFIFYLFIY